MIELAGVVTFRDGGTLAVVAQQSEMASWERHALRMGYPMAAPDLEHPGASVTMIRYLGYAAAHAGRPQSEWPSFEVWDASVADVTLDPSEAGEVPPYPAGSIGRLVAGMSVATGIAPAALLEADPHMLATIGELLAQRAEAIRGR